MRFILGVILGIILTIGTAYVVDAMHAAPGPGEPAAQHMVNWSVVNDNFRNLSTSVKDGWSRLTGKPRQPDHQTGT